jgi:hypothetical protein
MGTSPPSPTLLEPEPELDALVMVVRSVGWTYSLENVAQVMNTSDLPSSIRHRQPYWVPTILFPKLLCDDESI